MDPDQADQPGGSVSLDGDGSYVEYTQSGTVLSGDRPQQLIYDMMARKLAGAHDVTSDCAGQGVSSTAG